MTDKSTKKPLCVSSNGAAGAYIVVPVDQLAVVKRLLDENSVRYSADEVAISLDEEPEVAVIDLGRGTDPRAVQRLLDSIP
jgi:hypothetical protein